MDPLNLTIGGKDVIKRLAEEVSTPWHKVCISKFHIAMHNLKGGSIRIIIEKITVDVHQCIPG